MTVARIFQSGNSQAVRLPKEFRFDTDQVEILRRGEEVVLRPLSKDAVGIFEALVALPADCFAESREDDLPQVREAL